MSLPLRSVLLLTALASSPATLARCQNAAPAAEVQPPRLYRLGPLPANATSVTMTTDGTARTTTGPAGSPVLLHIDRRCKATDVTKLLETLRDAGGTQVLLAATLPDGLPGCFTLALPTAAETTPSIQLRLHRGRASIPPRSVTPLLTRMARGQKAAGGDPFVLGIEAPTDARYEQLLQVLAAASDAGVAMVALRCAEAGVGERPAQVDGGLGALAGALGGKPKPNAAAADDAGGFAIDLGPAPFVAVAPRALPQPRPAITDAPVGCLEQAPEPRAAEAGGQAGGMFGGRGRQARQFTDALQNAADWLAAQQRPDGSFTDDAGIPDVGATALVALALLGRGTTLIGGDGTETLRRAIGRLLDQQAANGALAENGPEAVHQHALATYALVEAYGLSSSLLLRGSIDDALAWLAKQQLDGDGFPTAAGGTEADATTTALTAIALASARLFAITTPLDGSEVATWFNAFDDARDVPLTVPAAALFSRFVTGAQMKEAVTEALVGRLIENAGLDDPWCGYWTTYGLFQVGGKPWKTWAERVAKLTDQVVSDGDDAGSWQPAGGLSRVATTALRVLTLQAWFRYTRIVR